MCVYVISTYMLRRDRERKKKRVDMTVIHSLGQHGENIERYRGGPGFVTLLSGGAVLIKYHIYVA